MCEAVRSRFLQWNGMSWSLRFKEKPNLYPLVSVAIIDIVLAGFNMIDRLVAKRNDLECLSFTSLKIRQRPLQYS
jgi:hypothetical protein